MSLTNIEREPGSERRGKSRNSGAEDTPRKSSGCGASIPHPDKSAGAKSFTFEVTSTAVNSGRQNVPVLRIVPHGAVVEPVELLEAQRQGLLLNA